MLGGLGPAELIIILVIVLVIFGPKNLPKLGASLGKTVKNIREGMESEDSKDAKDPKKIEAEDVDVVDEDKDGQE